MTSFAVIVLAAGGGSRMGRPKQLLPFRGASLVRHAARTALDSGAAQVVVVVGAHAEEVTAELAGLSVTVARNGQWQEGMASSIRAGVEAVSAELPAAIIALADQPLVPAEHLRGLAQLLAAIGAPCVASSYDGVLGVPAAFSRRLFPDLLALQGDTGARALLRASGVPSLPLPSAQLDIDAPEDYGALGRVAGYGRGGGRV